MKPEEKNIWFPAKRYGWGWGPPRCWQGWVFLLGWMVALIGGVYGLRPDRHLTAFIVFEGCMIAVLFIVCLLKGEKPGWRWGGK
jgi:hypothetical protein